MADVPVLSEYGYGINCDRPRGVIGPSGMDPELIARVDEVLCKAFDDPEFQKYLEDSGIQPIQMHEAEFRETYENVAKAVLDNMDLITGVAS